MHTHGLAQPHTRARVRTHTRRHSRSEILMLLAGGIYRLYLGAGWCSRVEATEVTTSGATGLQRLDLNAPKSEKSAGEWQMWTAPIGTLPPEWTRMDLGAVTALHPYPITDQQV